MSQPFAQSLPDPHGYVVPTADNGHTVELRAAGEFDLANAGILTAGLLSARREGRDVRVDMSGVAFLDVVALGELIVLRRVFVEHGQMLTLTSASPPVRRLLHAADVERELTGTPVGV